MRLLIILLGEFTLGFRSAMYVVKPFQVSGSYDLQADALHIASEVRSHPGFIAIRVRIDHALFVGVCFQKRTDRRVHLAVENNGVLLGLNRFKGRPSSVLHFTGGFDHRIDLVATKDYGGIIGDAIPTAFDHLLQFFGTGNTLHVRNTFDAVYRFRVCDGAIANYSQVNRGKRAQDL